MPQTTQTKKNDDAQNGLQKMQQKIAKLEQTVTILKAQLTVLTQVSPDLGEPQPPTFHGRYMEDVLN
ncbi:hypothetical protein IWQ61_002756 [Dispira simplex]|nr:hypothetical protein IWQ61_002756 [Dispira simplex]